jgi:hypothetical protein
MNDSENKAMAMGAATYRLMQDGALRLKQGPGVDVGEPSLREIVGPNALVQGIPEEYGDLTLGDFVQRAYRHLLNPPDRYEGVVDRFPFAVHRIRVPASSRFSVQTGGESDAYLYVTTAFAGASLCFDGVSSLNPISSQLIEFPADSLMTAVGIEGYIVDGLASGRKSGHARPLVPREHLCNSAAVSTYDAGDLHIAIHHTRTMSVRANMTIPVMLNSNMMAVVPLSGMLFLDMQSRRESSMVKSGGAALVPPGASPAFTPVVSNFMMIRMRG